MSDPGPHLRWLAPGITCGVVVSHPGLSVRIATLGQLASVVGEAIIWPSPLASLAALAAVKERRQR